MYIKGLISLNSDVGAAIRLEIKVSRIGIVETGKIDLHILTVFGGLDDKIVDITVAQLKFNRHTSCQKISSFFRIVRLINIVIYQCYGYYIVTRRRTGRIDLDTIFSRIVR